MNPRFKHDQLLNDVLAEKSAAGFREALLGQTLLQVRRRRHRRRAQQILGALGLALAVAWFLPRHPAPMDTGAATLAQSSYTLVRSQPLVATMICSTEPLAAKSVVVSARAVDVLRTTASSGGYREIGDDELLALSPGPAALVRRGPHQAELFFVNAIDEKPFHPD